MGRLDLDLSLKRVKAKFGHYEAEGRIGDRGGKGQLSGTLEIVDLRIVLDTLLRVYPGQPAYIININTVVSLKDIQANFKANWKCLTCLAPRDVSSCVNNILNVRMKELWAENDVFLNTLVAEGIREMVNRWWWW
ncbi:uncharacterized protein LOC112057893 [Bicyclus anynana]|uniref:Uncharacterized protein LOC112057893 n=1 Tax=Bicyclus anynana TaxID=110368 RepID=A0A6J1P8V5_BICAN|nr:uncharacterized protein LOC112057893 [Bicyclus anynana]